MLGNVLTSGDMVPLERFCSLDIEIVMDNDAEVLVVPTKNLERAIASYREQRRYNLDRRHITIHGAESIQDMLHIVFPNNVARNSRMRWEPRM